MNSQERLSKIEEFNKKYYDDFFPRFPINLQGIMGIHYDRFDAYSSLVNIFFGLANVLHFHGSIDIPAHWEYSPGAATGIDDEETPDCEILALFNEQAITEGNMIDAGNIIHDALELMRDMGLEN